MMCRSRRRQSLSGFCRMPKLSTVSHILTAAILHSTAALNADLLHRSVRQGLGEPGGLVHMTEKIQPAWFVPLIAGGMATAVADVVVHPIDTIKTVQQAGRRSPTNTIAGAIGLILKKSGPLGFYNGALPYITLDTIAGCIKFATYEAFNSCARANLSEEHMPALRFVSAGAAFLACSFVLVPGELVKQQLQSAMQPGLRAAVAHIYKTRGPIGFFQGYKATALRDVPYTMLELGLYDVVKTHLYNSIGTDQSSKVVEILSAAVVGGFVAYVTAPLDMIKTRMMTSAICRRTGTPLTITKIVQEIWFKEGPKQFMCGSIARVTWLMPFTAIYLPIYDATTRLLIKGQAAAAAAEAAEGKRVMEAALVQASADSMPLDQKLKLHSHI